MFIFEVLYISALKVFYIVLQSVPTLTRASAHPSPQTHNAAPSCGVQGEGKTGGLLVVVTATGCALPH